MMKDLVILLNIQNFYEVVDCIANFSAILGILITIGVIWFNRKKIKDFITSIERLNYFNEAHSIFKIIDEIASIEFNSKNKAIILKKLGGLKGKIQGNKGMMNDLNEEVNLITELLKNPKTMKGHDISLIAEQVKSKINSISVNVSKENN